MRRRNLMIAISIAWLLPVTTYLGTNLMIPTHPLDVPITPTLSREAPGYKQHVRELSEKHQFRRVVKEYVRRVIGAVAVIAGLLTPWGVYGAGLIAGGMITMLNPFSMIQHFYTGMVTTWFNFFILALVLALLAIPYIRIEQFRRLLKEERE